MKANQVNPGASVFEKDNKLSALDMFKMREKLGINQNVSESEL